MTALHRGPRLRLLKAARYLSAQGMNPGKSGNLSVRVDGGFIVTPSGIAYDHMRADDLVLLASDGSCGGGQGKPSSEWRLHRDIYANRSEAGAVVHTHSPYATTLACLRRCIPAFHYEVAFAGGADIRCGSYATFGTQELSDLAVAALEGRSACLLANHGAVALGEDLDRAVGLAEKVEALARLFWQSLQVGEPAVLDGVEMARVVDKFRTYGQ